VRGGEAGPRAGASSTLTEVVFPTRERAVRAAGEYARPERSLTGAGSFVALVRSPSPRGFTRGGDPVEGGGERDPRSRGSVFTKCSHRVRNYALREMGAIEGSPL